MSQPLTLTLARRAPRSTQIFGSLLVAALLVLAVGMILDSQRKRARQNFELQMNILASIQHLRDEK